MDVSDIKQEFDKVFGDMCLSDNDVALHIFELGYKAGAAAENEACAKACEQLPIPNEVFGAHHDYLEGKRMAVFQCADTIRARMK